MAHEVLQRQRLGSRQLGLYALLGVEMWCQYLHAVMADLLQHCGLLHLLHPEATPQQWVQPLRMELQPADEMSLGLLAYVSCSVQHDLQSWCDTKHGTGAGAGAALRAAVLTGVHAAAPAPAAVHVPAVSELYPQQSVLG